MTEANRPASRPRDWAHAWSALKDLIADPERTDRVFEIIRALSGDAFEHAWERFRDHPDSRRLLAERPSLLAALSDRAALRALPEHTLGRAYADFMDAAQLDAAGLVEAEETATQTYGGADDGPVDPDREFFGDRLRDMHDLWHVLTGYGRDEAGEAANLAFTYAQVPNLGVGFIVVAGAVLGPHDLSLYWQRYLFRAYRRGRRAALLTPVPYEKLLPVPLAEVRRQLAIEPPQVAHPEGVLVANRDEEPRWHTGDDPGLAQQAR
ncbi:MAG TPA: Coq4 family protein [Candidatus Dormibacteraeota bacterium]|nr:Coq4 family protein [Candidatus Dormibacteraeota bacterium]